MNIFFRINIFVLFFSLVFITKENSAKDSTKEINNLIISGLEQSYNFNWKEAERTFTKIINKYPNDPRGFYYKSIIYQWYFLGGEDKNDYENFMDLSDSVIEKASELLEKNPNNVEILYLLGSAYTYRGIVFTKAENYLNAAWAVKKSESYLSSVIEIDSSFYDAYFGLGLYNFAVSQIPTAFNWALSLAGIEGSKAAGINYLKIAARKGNFAKVEAQYYLSQIFSEVLSDYNKASYYLENLVKKYPQNIIFRYSYASLEIKKKNLNSAKKNLNLILHSTAPKFNQIVSLSNFLMGDVYFRNNNFENAKIYYLNFLADSENNDYKGIASYRLGISYELTGDSIQAEKYFENCDEGNPDLDDDIFAKRKGEIYFERKIDSLEIKVIKAGNMIYAGKYHQGYDSLYELLPLIKKDDLKAEVYLYLSQAAYNFANYDEALRMAFASQSIDLKEELWIKPFAVYYIAMSYKMLGNETAFHNFINEAENYENYDYQNKLQNLIYSIKVKDELASAKSLN